MYGHPVLFHDVTTECPDGQLIEHMNPGREQPLLTIEGDKLLTADGLIDTGAGPLNHTIFRRQYADRPGQHVRVRELHFAFT
ncbi:Uncharacterised protein [Escherichia coli]|nr:Uncharacterised protein [Escherichia coli]